MTDTLRGRVLPVELSADARFAGRVRRLAFTAVVALGVLWALATVTLEAPVAIDLALLLGPVSEYSVDNVELPDFALAWYAAAGTEPSEGSAAGYLERPVITYARNTRPYRELKALLLERVGPSAALFPSSSLSACLRLVEAGLGVAALPEALARPLVAA